MDAHYIPVMEEYDEIEREIDSLNDDLYGAMEVSSATVANVSTNQSAPTSNPPEDNAGEVTPSQEPKRHVKNSATVAKSGDGADAYVYENTGYIKTIKSFTPSDSVAARLDRALGF